MKITQIQLNKNKSAFFLSPLTLIPKSYFDKALNFYCLNAHKPDQTNHVFVLFDKDLLEEFEIQRFQRFNVFEEVQEYENYLLVTFRLLEPFHDDHRLFMEGKYSKYSDKAKGAIRNYVPKFVRDPKTKKDTISNYYKVIYPTSDDRRKLEEFLGVSLEDEAEIYSSPNLEEETFNISKLFNLFTVPTK